MFDLVFGLHLQFEAFQVANRMVELILLLGKEGLLLLDFVFQFHV